MTTRYANRSDTTDRVPNYYARNKLYPHAYQRTDYPTRTSRRIHDGFSLDRNYGIDTTSDELNTSPYASPYYINGRYNSNNLTTQTGNSASTPGITRLLTVHDELEDFTEEDIESYLKLWQGKQIKFSVPYTNKVVGITITLRNTKACTGILSVYLSASENGPVLAEAAVDLCDISQDNFEHRQIYFITPVAQRANPRGELYVRMEIWDEISCDRDTDPFNTGRYIEIAATGHSNHKACIYRLSNKNVPVHEEYNYRPQPSRPCLGLVYNNWESIPTNRNEGVDYGARFSLNGYSYSMYTIKRDGKAEVLIYDDQTQQLVENKIKVDGRATAVNIVQAAEYIYYTDGWSPLQRFEIGVWETYTFPVTDGNSIEAEVNLDTWVASGIAEDSGEYRFTYTENGWEYQDKPVNLATYGITINGEPALSSYISVIYNKATESFPADIDAKFVDTRPVIAASIILFHNNRIYLSGFRYDPNLVQCTEIKAAGPDFNSFPYRFYSPGRSPKSTSTNPIVAMVEYESDTLMIATTGGFALYQSNVNLEAGTPSQVSTYSDGAGVAMAGDITNYRGIIYSFDPDEGIRRFTGAVWSVIPEFLSSHVARVDMTKPRKIWGYSQKLYFNYWDKLDGKAKCLIWDMEMNYQQFPWFQDVDIPFCDVRTDNEWDMVGIHPQFPCIMKLYDTESWRRLDTPIVFERHTKRMVIPGNAADLILHRAHNKVLANSNRWWWLALNFTKHSNEQTTGDDAWYRVPCWAAEVIEQPVESPFPTQDVYEEYSTALLTLPNLNARAISVQEKIKAKTFRAQANLVSTLFEVSIRQYN